MGDKQATRIRTAKSLIQKSATAAAKQPLPTRVPVHPLLQLQHLIGNQAVTRLIQAKLTIGEPGDKYEQEADRVAAQVVSQINAPTPQQSSQEQTVQRQEMPEDEKLQTKPEISSIQRQEMSQEEELQTKPEISSIQRQEMPEDETLQTKPIVQRQPGGDGMAATPELEASIQQARGGGQPLSESIRKPMEQAFGADFSGVRVHTDATSDQLNRSIQAKAFTTGQDIFFRQGTYQPSSRGGQGLIAHELTHVVQQNGGAVQRMANINVIQRFVARPLNVQNTLAVLPNDPILMSMLNQGTAEMRNIRYLINAIGRVYRRYTNNLQASDRRKNGWEDFLRRTYDQLAQEIADLAHLNDGTPLFNHVLNRLGPICAAADYNYTMVLS